MIIMSFIILIVMFLMGINGKSRGVVNYKFSLEKTVLTLIFMPMLAVFIKNKLVEVLPEMISAIIGVILSLTIIFLILTFIFGKIANVPEYEYTSSDRTLGFLTGVLKGYALVSILIMFYAMVFADTVLPGVINANVKENFVNNKIENSVEYYRYTVYKIYRKVKSADVSSLTQKSEEYYSGEADIDLTEGAPKKNNLKGKTLIDRTVPGYKRWTVRDYSYKNDEPENNGSEKE